MLITESELRDVIREELIKEVINKKNVIVASLAFLASFANLAQTLAKPLTAVTVSQTAGETAGDSGLAEAIKSTEELEAYVKSLQAQVKSKTAGLQDGVKDTIEGQKSIAKALKKVNKSKNMKKNAFSQIEGLSVKTLDELNKNLHRDLGRGSGAKRARIAQAANLTGYLTNLGFLIIDHCAKNGSFNKLKENSLETYSNYIVSKMSEEGNTEFLSTQDIYDYFKNLGMLP